jgi:hypothetical protein
VDVDLDSAIQAQGSTAPETFIYIDGNYNEAGGNSFSVVLDKAVINNTAH